jgi:hypothetical protein
MIEVTEQAVQLLRDIRFELQGTTDEGRADKVLRLVYSGGSFGVSFDFPREGDHVIQSGGTDILLVGRELADAIPDATIGCQDTPEGSRLVIAASQ